MPHLLLKDLPRYECLLEAAQEFPDLDPSALEAFLHPLRTADEAFAVTERKLSAHHITPGRFNVLMLLWRGVAPRQERLQRADACLTFPRNPAELAEAAGVTRATMTGLVDTLERDGYVQREPDPDDRRMMSVRLTAKAETFLRDYLPTHFQTTGAIMAALTEGERKTLVTLLGKVQAQAATLRDGPPGGAPATLSPALTGPAHA